MADDQNSVSSSTSRLPRSQEGSRDALSEAPFGGSRAAAAATSATATTTTTITSLSQEEANINGPTASFSEAPLSSGDLNGVSSSCLMLDSEQQVAASETLPTTSTSAAATTNPEIITTRPLILITDLNSPTSSQGSASCLQGVTSSSHYYEDYSKTQHKEYNDDEEEIQNTSKEERRNLVGRDGVGFVEDEHRDEQEVEDDEDDEDEEQEDEEQVEEIDGIRYRIVAAVTTKQRKRPPGGRKGRPKQNDERVSSKAIKGDSSSGKKAFKGADRETEMETETGSGAAAASSTKSALNSYKQQQQQQQPYRTNQGQPVDRPKVVIMVAGSGDSKVGKDYNYNNSQDVNDNYSSNDRIGEHFRSASSAQTKGHQNFADQQYNNYDGANNNPSATNNKTKKASNDLLDDNEVDDEKQQSKLSKHNTRRLSTKSSGSRLSFVRRKSSAFVANLLQTSSLQATSNNELGPNMNSQQKVRRLSIYEMTKSPPPETSLEIYLSERRRSSTVSSKHVQQQLAEQQSTFETNYCQRQQYFKDLNQKLINQDKKLLNVVANRGQIHRHSVDIAQLPLVSAAAKGSKSRTAAANGGSKQQQQEVVLEATNQEVEDEQDEEERKQTFVEGQTSKQIIEEIGAEPLNDRDKSNQLSRLSINQSRKFQNSSSSLKQQQTDKICLTEQVADSKFDGDFNHHFDGHRDGQIQLYKSKQQQPQTKHQLAAIKEDGRRYLMEQRGSIVSSRGERIQKSRIVIRKFQKLDPSELSSTPAPDVKIGQRIAYKEYYGNEFGTIRWIGRVPQICPDWTVGVEFDNAIGEGDGSLNGRRYFIAKDCFAKFLPLNAVALVDQHVGRPEPGTMISVMSAAVRPGQMISIQRVSTVHVQHCFLNAPHQRPTGADILAVNTRLHCQCPNCGPCAHVIKPPRTQRLARAGKNATHMCQFSTYTCCGMESSEEATCTYTGNKIASYIPPNYSSPSMPPPPPIGNSWIEGAGYLTNLQAQQSKSMPEEYKLGSAPEDVVNLESLRRFSRSSSRRGSGRRRRHKKTHDSTNVKSSQSPTDMQIDDNNNINNNNKTHATGHTTAMDKPNTNFYQYPSTTQDLNSYTPSPDPNQFALACPDKTTSNADDVNWFQENNSKGTPRSPKVVYRNSIENRYLFPTDEPIDSTLEADLENLSQARYGPTHSSRLSGSRNIFKSLLSLVSCLSAHSNHSEFDRHSENTLHFSEQTIKNNINKATPKIATSSERYSPQLNDISEKDSYQLESGPSAVQSCEHNQTGVACSDHRVRRHISSSSDCGFSSASQNSFNFQSYPACSPIMTADDEHRTKQIYKRIVTRLMNSTSVSNEDIHRLKGILFEPQFENCCLHTNINHSTFNNFGNLEADQIIADIIQKSYLKQDKHYEQQQMPRPASNCHHTTNYCLSSSGVDKDQAGGIYRSAMDRHKKVVGSDKLEDESEGLNMELNASSTAQNYENQCEVSKSLNRSLVEGSLTSESATLSSYDSYCGTAIVGDNSNASNTDSNKKDMTKLADSRPSSENSNLPKAFELKLTLSINSDKKTQITSVKDSSGKAVDYSSVHEDSSGSNNGVVNSTFNINIVSNHQDEEDSKKNCVQ